MAFQVIGTYDIYSWEQEEIIDKQLIAGEDGVVNEVETLIQPYAKIEGKLIVSQDLVAAENYSNIKAELWMYATAGERGDGFTINPYVRYYLGYTMDNRVTHITLNDRYFTCTSKEDSGYNYNIEVKPGETISNMVTSFKLNNEAQVCSNYSYNKTRMSTYHGFDGVLNQIIDFGNFYNNVEGYYYSQDIVPIETATSTLVGKFDFIVKKLLSDGSTTNKAHSKAFEIPFPELLPNDRAVTPLTADSFTDEGNPSFVYSATPQYSYVYAPSLSENDYGYVVELDTITSLQAALSFDGVTPDVGYRDIPIDGSNYTFSLTAAERDIIRAKAQGSDNVPIYYLVKVTRTFEDQSETFVSKTQRILTIVGCNPTLNPTVKDIKEETLALTGDENTFVRYESMAEYAINATASKGATIVSQSVTCGSKTISNLPNGIIDDVESGTFIFNVTDSRSMGASSSVFKNLVEYVKPTCYQKVEIELSGETGANIKVTANGSYFNDSFGAANNTLKLEVRYTDDNGTMGAWQTISGTPTYNGNTYKLEATFGGFNYGKAYVFQCRATDKLNVVESSQYTIRLLPVFDWSETDFNFNVPVNIDAEDLSMHGETIIRHSDSTNNTVLSASNGHIYVRPGGTDDTGGQTIFYNNGNVDISGNINAAGNATFGGTVGFDGSFSINGYTLNDFVIATGEEAMGTNGTWYWRKWKSGKAEAWGCRNFGNMAVTTTWGNLYRSAVLTQNLPDNVFIRTPDSININIVHATYGGWICKHEQTAPSAATTGSFIFVRPASATVTAPTNIGFYIVGEW